MISQNKAQNNQQNNRQEAQDNRQNNGTQKLRTGFTTGACATAAAKAALILWHSKICPEEIWITLPSKGGKNTKDAKQVCFKIDAHSHDETYAQTSIIKDAGDDPDITHGAQITSRVTLKIPQSEKTGKPQINFFAGEGVGIITKPGLPLPQGEAAINPVPRQMISQHLSETAQELGIDADFDVTISVANGEELAKHTWNPRLGIIGGLSILGTTGIVRPYSCSAWIHSIHRGIDVARAIGLKHIIGSTGNLSEQAAIAHYQPSKHALIDMGDFAGGMLKYLRRHPVEKITICGGFGKILKLAAGHSDLHSKRSQIDFTLLYEWALSLGLDMQKAEAIKRANSAQHLLEILGVSQERKIFLSFIAQSAKCSAEKIYDRNAKSDETIFEIIIINRQGQIIYPFLAQL